VLGLLPVPGPFDEIVLFLVAAVLFVFYRDVLREAWRATELEPSDVTVHTSEA
jgi:hypothetical protein